MRPDLDLPAGVEEMRSRGEDWAAWVDRLPRLAADLLTEWDLRVDGEATHGYCALVLPVVLDDGTPAALKIAFPDEESEHEHVALQHWHGDGAAMLLRADPRRSAMLLERLGPDTLEHIWDVEACEVVGGLYGRLHVAALPQLRPVSGYVARWADDLEALPSEAPIPRRLRSQALSLARDLVAEAADTHVVHGDLHYANVLAGVREPWLVIDPKAMNGDPHYEPAAMLWNRWDEYEPGRVRDGIRRRFHTLVDVAGLDEDRARDWVVVRMVLNASWRLLDPNEMRSRTSDDAWLTMCFTLAKAVQD